MNECMSSLPESEAILSMDFSEDYMCHFQNEIQSSYFDKRKVSIHPMHTVYKQKYEGKSVTVKHSIIGVTEDNTKDYRSMDKFEKIAIQKIQEQMPTELLHVNEFTDGCSKQYKGRNAFYWLSHNKSPSITRNFYDTSHGKSVCDELGPIVKSACYRSVLGQAIIGSAKDLYNYCSENLTVNFKVVRNNENQVTHISIREFVFLPKVHKEEVMEVKTLDGTCKIHSMKTTDEVLKVKT